MVKLYQTKKIMKEYKVLTLWEPWATLFAHGIKKIETRPNPTSWTMEKGSYLIHSAKKWSKEQEEICLTEHFKKELKPLLDFDDFHFGCIIGAVDIVECKKISILSDECINIDNIILFDNIHDTIKLKNSGLFTLKEKAFGDYSEGRYAWIGTNFRLLETPIPFKGKQGYYVPFKGDVSQLKFKQ